MTTEDWARNIVADELGMKVKVYDDGSEAGMYDLIIGSASAPEYAIECVGAVDPVATETWNIGPAKGPIKIHSSGDWIVSIKKSANIKSLKLSIAAAICECEELGLIEYSPVDWQMRRCHPNIFKKLDDLGITSIHMYRAGGNGDVHLSMDVGGGPVNQNGNDVADWIGYFLSTPEKADVVEKLRRSEAAEKHAFIPIVLGGAPWKVESYFFGEMSLPCTVPKLPEPITGAWIVLNGKGLRYTKNQWHVFSY